jgi:LPXTG-motif cell wall-anchored protein
MDVSRGSPTFGSWSPALALGTALLAAAMASPAAVLAAAPDVAPVSRPAAAPPPRAAGDSSTSERVLDVTFAPAGSAGSAGATQPSDRGRQAGSAATTPTAASAATAASAPRTRAGAVRSGGGASGWWLAWIAAAILAAAGGLLAWRRRRRRCASCSAAMRRLGPEAAFAELDMAERTEHLVGDVRYEIWRCPACGAVDKRGAARDLSRLKTGAGGIGAPVGSAAFLLRRAQSGLSIWSPPPPTNKPWPKPVVVSPPVQRFAARPGTEPPSVLPPAGDTQP